MSEISLNSASFQLQETLGENDLLSELKGNSTDTSIKIDENTPTIEPSNYILGFWSNAANWYSAAPDGVQLVGDGAGKVTDTAQAYTKQEKGIWDAA